MLSNTLHDLSGYSRWLWLAAIAVLVCLIKRGGFLLLDDVSPPLSIMWLISFNLLTELASLALCGSTAEQSFLFFALGVIFAVFVQRLFLCSVWSDGLSDSESESFELEPGLVSFSSTTVHLSKWNRLS